MKTEVGEYAVGAYHKLVENCDFVDYNVRPSGGGLAGLAELDVVGLRLSGKVAFVCEVTTHLEGLNYGTYDLTLRRLEEKSKRQRIYAQKNLKHFNTIHFMLWSPVVRRGKITHELEKITGLELVINEEYGRRIEELQEMAARMTRDTGNPFFRILQLLAHLRKD
jgi:hypothetical protein